MDASSLQRHQDIMASQSLDSILVATKSQTQQEQSQDKKSRPPAEQAQHCPRCDSTNTKFCYYNNYSLSQPRYFCKSCRRYWTKGGTLRNVPVGGGCRKNRRCSSSSSSRRSTPDHLQNLMSTTPTSSSQQSMISPLTSSYEHHNYPSNHHDLSLAFAHHGNISILGNHGNNHFDLFGNHLSGNFLDSLRGNLVQHENANSHNNNGLHLYYGLGNLGGAEHNGGSHDDQPMGMQFDLLHQQNHQEIMSNPSSGSSTPTIKQELGDNNRSVLLNYLMTSGEIDTPRESCWNTGVLGSSWPHHLVNSPLM